MSEHTSAGDESRARPDASTRLNSDDRERLQTLDGVGAVTADRLVQEFGSIDEIVRTALRAHDAPACRSAKGDAALACFEAVDGFGHTRAERLVETIVDEWTDAGDVIQSTRVATDGGIDKELECRLRKLNNIGRAGASDLVKEFDTERSLCEWAAEAKDDPTGRMESVDGWGTLRIRRVASKIDTTSAISPNGTETATSNTTDGGER